VTYLAGALLRKACILGYLLPISRGRAHPITDSLLTYPAEAAAFNTAMSTWRAQRDEAWKKYAGLM
jgi:hypothetical protein